MKKFIYILNFILSVFILSSNNLIYAQGSLKYFEHERDEYGSGSYNGILSGLGSSGNCVNVSHNALLDQNTDGTLEIWIYPTSFNTNAILVSKGTTANQSFCWGIDYITRLMYLRIGNSTLNNTGGIILSPNIWTHVAVSWTGGPNFFITFYVDGVMSGTPGYLTDTWNLNSDPFRIGASQYFTTQYFVGNIDEVKYWADVRNITEIRENRFIGLGDYNGANSGYALTSCVPYDNLISSWTFNTGGMAYDDISGLHGNYYGASNSAYHDLGVPVPYNLALRMFGSSGDNFFTADHSIYDQTADGSIELWFRPTSFANSQIFMSKGSTMSNISFLFGVGTNGVLFFRTGGNSISSNGSALTLNRWQHVCVTWQVSGGTFQIYFYVNGVQNGTMVTLPASFPVNADRVYVGSSQVLSSYNVNGWIDELRFWNQDLTPSEILNYMFVSGRVLSSSTGLLACWNFDGNLRNFTTQTGINGSFNNGLTNNARFSAYVNEINPGNYSTAFVSHATVINRGGTPNSFPNGFYKAAPFVAIPDNNMTGIQSTINVPHTGNVSVIEVFLSIEHSWVGDLVVTLTAPNGQSRTFLTNNGSAGDNILTFVGDAFNYMPNSSVYLPPWGFIKPMITFGNFGNSIIQGNWTLKCVDNASGDVGVLKGWGFRVNNSVMVGTENISSNVPERFNLYQNYPNPFNPNTNISFDIPKDCHVSITVFDLLGREVNHLINEFKRAGSYNINFNADGLASGIYFYRINAGDFSDVKKMTLVK